ncbi:ribonuclease T [Shigella flexneri 1235-66]|nr:ribonuclease T [Shigella flexneri 1235-66]
MEHFPALNADCFDKQISERLQIQEPPRILILYGSVRERSYSRFAAEEVGRLLTAMGAEVRLFNPSGLPLPDPQSIINCQSLAGIR